MRHPAGALAAIVIASAVPLAATVPLAVRVPPAARGSAGSYPDDPPPATTGGFGEPTCAACHMAGSVPDSSGSLSLEGLPASYELGSSYELSIVLARPEMERAGFELSARFAEGEGRGAQAGGLRAMDERAAVTESAGVQYSHQTAAGSSPPKTGLAGWRIEWEAPAHEAARVVFHVAGNAANGDASALGDHVYSLEAAIEPALETSRD